MPDRLLHTTDLLAALFVHIALTALPGIAVVLYAARRGVREEPVLLGYGLAGSGAAGMLAFWAYYADPAVGTVFAYVLPVISVGVSLGSLYGSPISSAVLKGLWTPLLLWILGSTFLVFLGFMYGGTSGAIRMAATRFSHQLPFDNYLPLYFSDWFFKHGHLGVAPPIATWQASDRPPLQMGYVLAQRPLNWFDTSLEYQILGVLLQQLWIVGLWALLVGSRVERGTRAWIMIAVLVSDLAIVNGFFVWPKMLAAAFLLAATALVATPLWADVRRSYACAAALASLIALSLLSHAASLFGVIPLILFAVKRGLPNWKWAMVGALTGALIMSPWSAYQRYGDPPGNRLTKWMIGGAQDIDRRGALETIVASYRTAGWSGTLDNKAQNFATMIGWLELQYWGDRALNELRSGDFSRVVFDLRALAFFDVLPQMGLLLLGPISMVLGYRRRYQHLQEWTFALTCGGIFLLGCACWGLLMFGSSDTRAVIHTGSLAVLVLGICSAVAALRVTFPRLAVCVIATRLLLTLVLYVPSYAPTPDLKPYTEYSAFRAILAVGGLVGFALLSFGRRNVGGRIVACEKRLDVEV